MGYGRTAILLGLMTALLTGIGLALGGMAGGLIAFLFAAAVNFLGYWFSDRIALGLHGARPITGGEVEAIVKDLAARADLPAPRVYLIDSLQPNAFATGRNPAHGAIAVTQGLLNRLDERQLRGVIAHELSHIRNRDTLIMTVAATFAGAIELLARFGLYGLRAGPSRRNREAAIGLLFLPLLIFAPLAALLIRLAISRGREFAADRRGAEICGQPLWLAEALGQLDRDARLIANPQAEDHPQTAHLFIVNPLSGGTLASLFSTHPPIAERIARLRAMAGTPMDPMPRKSPLPSAGATIERRDRD